MCQQHQSWVWASLGSSTVGAGLSPGAPPSSFSSSPKSKTSHSELLLVCQDSYDAKSSPTLCLIKPASGLGSDCEGREGFIPTPSFIQGAYKDHLFGHRPPALLHRPSPSLPLLGYVFSLCRSLLFWLWLHPPGSAFTPLSLSAATGSWLPC